MSFVNPTLVKARHAAQRTHCRSNLTQIGLAILNYESANKQLPPAYTVDANGNRLHSWRTLILPFLGQQTLYSRIDLSKPWDDPVNAFLQDVDIPMFRCLSSKIAPGMTTYQVIDDPTSTFPGSTVQKLESITDGLSNTIFVVESNDLFSVHWAEPKDHSMSSYLSTIKSSHRGGRHFMMGDGSVQFLVDITNPAVLKGLVTRQGNEAVELDNK